MPIATYSSPAYSTVYAVRLSDQPSTHWHRNHCCSCFSCLGVAFTFLSKLMWLQIFEELGFVLLQLNLVVVPLPPTLSIQLPIVCVVRLLVQANSQCIDTRNYCCHCFLCPRVAFTCLSKLVQLQSDEVNDLGFLLVNMRVLSAMVPSYPFGCTATSHHMLRVWLQYNLYHR